MSGAIIEFVVGVRVVEVIRPDVLLPAGVGVDALPALQQRSLGGVLEVLGPAAAACFVAEGPRELGPLDAARHALAPVVVGALGAERSRRTRGVSRRWSGRGVVRRPFSWRGGRRRVERRRRTSSIILLGGAVLFGSSTLNVNEDSDRFQLKRTQSVISLSYAPRDLPVACLPFTCRHQ